MGNLCSYDAKKIEHLQNKLEEQDLLLEELLNENRLLKRENKYCKQRLDKITYNNNNFNNIL